MFSLTKLIAFCQFKQILILMAAMHYKKVRTDQIKEKRLEYPT